MARDERWYRASGPGNLGFSLYTYRTADLKALRERIAAAGVPWLGPAVSDEFGALSSSCRSPDGYVWSFFQA
jgi:uncharacterized glyoxalase superfamily protein PhnB